MSTRGRICVAMSGGVDSAVAAGLLVEQGHAVIGVTLRLFCSSEFGTRATACCSAESIRHAAEACERFGIPHVVLDEKDTFRRSVIEPFADSYVRGETPIPCVACNTDVKFGSLFDRIESLGATAIATGHYARIDEHGTVRRAVDARKDQTYFLWGLDRRRLRDVRFPVGDLPKDVVRTRAREWSLPMADAPESQDICFVAGRDYADVVLENLEERDAPPVDRPHPGAMVDTRGVVVGAHRGLVHYTVGQRKGLGAAALAGGAPAYVVDVDASTNTVVVGREEELFSRMTSVRGLNWLIDPPAPGSSIRAVVQIRHRHAAAHASVHVATSGAAHVEFDEPQRAITPGQSAVFYDGDRLLGGGVVQRRSRAEGNVP